MLDIGGHVAAVVRHAARAPRLGGRRALRRRPPRRCSAATCSRGIGDVRGSTSRRHRRPGRAGRGRRAGSLSLHPSSGATIRRLAELDVDTLALMHGPAFTGDCRDGAARPGRRLRPPHRCADIGSMTSLPDPPNTALLIIDVQNGVVAGAPSVTPCSPTSTPCRQGPGRAVPVVWVQHSDEGLPRDSDGWQLVDEVSRGDSEPVVHKNFGDSFEDTELEELLAERRVGRLVVTGAQTDACVRCTLHGALRARLRRHAGRRRAHHRGPHRVRAPLRPSRSSPTPTSTGSTRAPRDAPPAPSTRRK